MMASTAGRLRSLLPFMLLTGTFAAGDPFDPSRLTTGKSLPSLNPRDLEFFEPGQLTLVGTIGQASRLQALLQDPKKRVYRVVEGSLIGHGGWRVVAIGEASVTLAPPRGEAAVAQELRLSLASP